MPMQVHHSAQLVWTNASAGAWPTIAANGNSGVINVMPYQNIALLIAALGTPTGTSPTLQFTVTAEDNQGNQFSLGTGAQSTSITAAGNQMLSLGLGLSSTPIFIPQLVLVSWVVGGTTPSFPNVQVSLYGR